MFQKYKNAHIQEQPSYAITSYNFYQNCHRSPILKVSFYMAPLNLSFKLPHCNVFVSWNLTRNNFFCSAYQIFLTTSCFFKKKSFYLFFFIRSGCHWKKKNISWFLKACTFLIFVCKSVIKVWQRQLSHLHVRWFGCHLVKCYAQDS